MASLKYKTQNGYEPIPAQVVTKTNAQQGNGIGTCSTSSGTALAVTLANYELVLNGFIAVTFDHDVPASATLNVNGKGAKPIIYKGSAIEDNVIKEDDTVTFCYDGTNYVVTSLGGSLTQTGELVIINLSTDDNDDSDLIGASVKIYNTNVQLLIYLETTWSGTSIQHVIPYGINYTIEVGNTNGHEIIENKQTYTASILQRNVNFVYGDILWVDLGLPSGTLWANKNIGADLITDPGLYFSWGNIIGHSIDETYTFDLTSYNSTPGSLLTADYSANDTYDAAYHILGNRCRVPSKKDAEEMVSNCSLSVETINDIICVKFTSSTNGKFIYLPILGYWVGDTRTEPLYGHLTLSTMIDTNQCRNMFYKNIPSMNYNDNTYKWNGLNIRPVRI